jgi:hypothetical protein
MTASAKTTFYAKVINMAFLPDELIHYMTDDSFTVARRSDFQVTRKI